MNTTDTTNTTDLGRQLALNDIARTALDKLAEISPERAALAAVCAADRYVKDMDESQRQAVATMHAHVCDAAHEAPLVAVVW